MESPKPIKLWIQPDSVPTFYQRGSERRKFLVDNPKLSRGKAPAKAVYLLNAISALRFYGVPLEILLSNSVSVEQINELLKPLRDRLGRPGVKVKADGWERFFFGNEPLCWYLEPQTEYCPLLVSFRLQCVTEVEFADSNLPLSELQLIYLIRAVLGMNPPQLLSLELTVVDVNRYSRRIDNGTFTGFIRSGECVRTVVKSNYPIHFCCFWADPNSRIVKLHPNIEEEPGYSEYLADFQDPETGCRTLISPSNNMLIVPDTSGLALWIVLGNVRKFETTNIEEIRTRISILLTNYSFHKGSSSWGHFESSLDNIIRPRIERIRRPMGLLPKTSASEWNDKIVEQMNGLASKVSILYIPQNPPQMFPR